MSVVCWLLVATIWTSTICVVLCYASGIPEGPRQKRELHSAAEQNSEAQSTKSRGTIQAWLFCPVFCFSSSNTSHASVSSASVKVVMSSHDKFLVCFNVVKLGFDLVFIVFCMWMAHRLPVAIDLLVNTNHSFNP